MRYKVWVTSSRSFEKTGEIESDDENIFDDLESWCRQVFPMFDYTDAFVRYGYDEIKEKANE